MRRDCDDQKDEDEEKEDTDEVEHETATERIAFISPALNKEKA